MSATDPQSFSDALNALDTALQQNAPEIARALLPGITPDAFEPITSRLSVEVPDEVRAMYLWHNGADVVIAGDRAQLFPGGQMLPLGEAVQTALEAREASAREAHAFWDPNWLPLFTDNLGDWHVVACHQVTNPILAISMVDLPDTETAFPDLEHMIVALERRWRTGAYKQGPDGTVDADIRAVAALYREEDGKPPNLGRLLADLNEGSLADHGNALSLIRTRLYPSAVPGLMQLLQNGTPRGRRAAAELLGSIGDVAARPALQAAAENDPEELVRLYASKSADQLQS